MASRNRFHSLMVVIVALAMVACGNDSTPEPTATTPEPTNSTPVTLSPAATADKASTATTTPMATTPATSTISSPAALADSSDAPAEYTPVLSSDNENIPTPNLEKKQQEMAPTAVIINGEYPYPTANSAIDSNGDGFYEIPELEEAVTETYPAYQWPNAYHPTLDEVFEMMDFNRVPDGARFEVPMELTLLGSLNRCAWEQNWLDAFRTGDPQSMDMSMSQLRATVLTNPNNVYIAASASEMYDQAELGDPARLVRNLKQNCYGFNRWVENRGSAIPLKDDFWLYGSEPRIVGAS